MYIARLYAIYEFPLSAVLRKTIAPGRNHFDTFRHKMCVHNKNELMSWVEKKADPEAKLGLVKVRGQNNSYIFSPSFPWMVLDESQQINRGLELEIRSSTTPISWIDHERKRRRRSMNSQNHGFAKKEGRGGHDIKTDIPNCQHCSKLKKASF